MNKFNYIICSRSVFEEALGLSRSTAYEHLKYLQELNFIHIEHSDKGTQYVVNPNIIWWSDKRNLKHCPFPPEKVMLSFPAPQKNTYKKGQLLYIKHNK